MSLAGFPLKSDVHLRIWLSGVAYDFCATWVVAQRFIREWKQRRCESIEVIVHSIDEELGNLPRLPCERLFADPGLESHAASTRNRLIVWR